jgi:hypothetical protein
MTLWQQLLTLYKEDNKKPELHLRRTKIWKILATPYFRILIFLLPFQKYKIIKIPNYKLICFYVGVELGL